MAQQLAYVIITPYTLHKSRTGGIIARLITRTGLELVAARMFAPSAELVQQYSEVIVSGEDPQDRRIQELIRDYILRNMAPDAKTKRRRRVMMLVFRGEEAMPDHDVGGERRDQAPKHPMACLLVDHQGSPCPVACKGL